MDSTVHARFWRVAEPAPGVDDFPTILAEEAKEPKAGKRERDVAEGVRVRLERCVPNGDFLEGEFCRVQSANIPPQAGPDGLEPMQLPAGRGIGHVAAFSYHLPTRVLLLQRNALSVNPNRISLYIAMSKPDRFFAFAPVMCGDAMERFATKEPRAFTVTFAAPKNLKAFDDYELPAAKGARLIAEAYDGVRVTVEVSVGKSQRLKLNKAMVMEAIQGLAGIPGVKKLKVRAEEDGEDDIINFIKEQLQYEKKAVLPEGDPEQNYEVRKLLLRAAFGDSLPTLEKQFNKP